MKRQISLQLTNQYQCSHRQKSLEWFSLRPCVRQQSDLCNNGALYIGALNTHCTFHNRHSKLTCIPKDYFLPLLLSGELVT